MYRGELAISKIQYAKNESLCELKNQAEIYPGALKKSLINFFIFEAEFSLMFVKANAGAEDKYYIHSSSQRGKRTSHSHARIVSERRSRTAEHRRKYRIQQSVFERRKHHEQGDCRGHERHRARHGERKRCSCRNDFGGCAHGRLHKARQPRRSGTVLVPRIRQSVLIRGG